MEKVHVLFVREAEQQMSNSGCCGRLSGDLINLSEVTGERLFRERRQIMEEMGLLYRRLDEQFGEQVELDVIDPRNIILFVVVLWRQWRRKKVPLSQMLMHFSRGFHTKAIFVNGELVAAGEIPRYDLIADKVLQMLTRQRERK
ncbi:hypothetical protein LOK74_19760 [Brevibacillus humidisoli]|uniref:hypothetical protein n=1 Tax=Brevibacillus humidisoli TaxID=2895522 RepID=UPI001E2F7F45|nr:hypothetical protein [Brevibacillus humidisoli]UFJ40247.1 hypothetical protein LOK74_19760 [Brevibacillus humidisoli]